MIANYDSTCLICHDPIEAGFDEIAYDDAEGAWVHEGCV